MEVTTALLTITLPIIATIIFTSRRTQRILGEIREAQVGIQHCLAKLEQLHRDTHCLLRKLDVGLKANAAMHGWARVDDVSAEEIAKLPEPKVYDAELRICYYKPV
jgi:hypothetical protein